jgi:hypothetical protein
VVEATTAAAAATEEKLRAQSTFFFFPSRPPRKALHLSFPLSSSFPLILPPSLRTRD